jgi:hypothetical protein
MRKSHSKKGFALIYVMLILASIVVALSLAASQSGFFSANRLKLYTGTAEVRMIGMYCAENLLMQIRATPGLTGTGSLSYNGGSCDYAISGSIPNKTIDITAVKDNNYKKLTVTTSQIYPSLITSWVESQ